MQKVTDAELIREIDSSFCRDWVIAHGKDGFIRVGDVIDLAKRLHAYNEKNEKIILLADHTIKMQQAEIDRLKEQALRKDEGK
jgi:uncharacterized protein (DUF305 family)